MNIRSVDESKKYSSYSNTLGKLVVPDLLYSGFNSQPNFILNRRKYIERYNGYPMTIAMRKHIHRGIITYISQNKERLDPKLPDSEVWYYLSQVLHGNLVELKFDKYPAAKYNTMFYMVWVMLNAVSGIKEKLCSWEFLEYHNYIRLCQVLNLEPLGLDEQFSDLDYVIQDFEKYKISYKNQYQQLKWYKQSCIESVDVHKDRSLYLFEVIKDAIPKGLKGQYSDLGQYSKNLSKFNVLTEFKHFYPNKKDKTRILVVDIDKPYEDSMLYKEVVAEPNLIVFNKDNKKFHIWYVLDNWYDFDFVCGVQKKLKRIFKYLEVNPFYTNDFTKNPLHENHSVIVIREKYYNIQELADYVNNYDMYKTRQMKNIVISCNHRVETLIDSKVKEYINYYDNMVLAFDDTNDNIKGFAQGIFNKEIGNYIISTQVQQLIKEDKIDRYLYERVGYFLDTLLLELSRKYNSIVPANNSYMLEVMKTQLYEMRKKGYKCGQSNFEKHKEANKNKVFAILGYYLDGYKTNDIAYELGYNRSTIHRQLKNLGIDTNKRGYINNMEQARYLYDQMKNESSDSGKKHEKEVKGNEQ